MTKCLFCSLLGAGLFFSPVNDISGAREKKTASKKKAKTPVSKSIEFDSSRARIAEYVAMRVKNLAHEDENVRYSAIRSIYRIASNADRKAVPLSILKKYKTQIKDFLIKEIDRKEKKSEVCIHAINVFVSMKWNSSDVLPRLIAIAESKSENHDLRIVAMAGSLAIASRIPHKSIAKKTGQTLIRIDKNREETNEIRKAAAYIAAQLRPTAKRAAEAFIHVIKDIQDETEVRVFTFTSVNVLVMCVPELNNMIISGLREFSNDQHAVAEEREAAKATILLLEIKEKARQKTDKQRKV